MRTKRKCSAGKPSTSSSSTSRRRKPNPKPIVDFAAVNATTCKNLLQILKRWLPEGQVQGHEYLAINPHRADRHLGSFRINLKTGRWADFATDDKGGDVVSLAAYLFALSQVEAARRLAGMLGVSHG